MKKNISIKGLVLLLALCLGTGSFAMYGCGSDENEFEGRFKCIRYSR